MNEPVGQIIGDLSNDSPILVELREKIKQWCRTHGQKQSTFAANCGIDPADLGHFLSSKALLPPYALANLATQLEMDPMCLLVQSEISLCVRKLEEGADQQTSEISLNRHAGWKLARDAYAALLRSIPNDGQVAPHAVRPGTLVDWSKAFLPLVVFVGDRREAPPKTPADLLAASASMGDLYYLSRLSLPSDTEIRSDKTCVITSPESLRTLLEGKNLLVIGSPAANLMARAINGGSCFSFHVTPDALTQAYDFQKLLEPIRYLPGELERYTESKCETPIQKEWSRRRRHLIYMFARSGILDPVDYAGLRGTSTGPSSDYGVVSLCKHPWSDSHVAIMAAGLHGPATAAAVKLLSKKDAFKNHPLGGVFRVNVPNEAPWEERYHHLDPEWDTHEYSVEKYEADVRGFHAQDPEMKFWNPQDVMALLEVIRVNA